MHLAEKIPQGVDIDRAAELGTLLAFAPDIAAQVIDGA